MFLEVASLSMNVDDGLDMDVPARIYPVGPLIEAAGTRDAAMTAMRVSGSRLRSFVERGLTEEQADRYAARLGHHPLKMGGLIADDARIVSSEPEKIEVVGWSGAVIRIAPIGHDDRPGLLSERGAS